MEKSWFNIVFFFFWYWNTIGKVLVYYCYIYFLVLEKYWFSIGFLWLFGLGKDGSLCWNSVGQYWINIVVLFWNSIGKELD